MWSSLRLPNPLSVSFVRFLRHRRSSGNSVISPCSRSLYILGQLNTMFHGIGKPLKRESTDREWRCLNMMFVPFSFSSPPQITPNFLILVSLTKSYMSDDA
ncbi:hypothetical protein PRUPE_2G117800 [Prunus persica]|uniref:Uncharacterized protein n=1 Tax=Prunus persica TaxID=3760 RepID=A0A251QET4_PRUPE|nr:hypothetical protein PRUPE_2G117800 [Prunus persica]